MATNTTDRQLVWVVLAIVAALVLFPALTMGFGVMGMGPMMGNGWGHGMWGASDGTPGWTFVVGVGIQLLFLVLLVGAGYLGYNALTARTDATDPALEEHRERRKVFQPVLDSLTDILSSMASVRAGRTPSARRGSSDPSVRGYPVVGLPA